MMNHILVYGLSADPVHRAHSDLVADAVPALIKRGYAVTRALIVPVYRRNLPKRDRPAPYEQRLAMCQIAAQEIQRRVASLGVTVEVSRIEEKLAAKSDRPNYTVKTLAALQRSHRSAGLIFLMSSDLLSGPDPEFARWRGPDKIVRLAVIAVAVRPGYAPDDRLIERYAVEGGQFVLLNELTPAAISGWEIRARIAAGENPLRLAEEGLLLPGVGEYILEKRLYSQPVS
jgi:nicotinate (nicotinamide) nucleotide adenylyltransferase